MASLAALLKDEINQIVKRELAKVQADIKKSLGSIEGNIERLERQTKKTLPAKTTPTPEPSKSTPTPKPSKSTPKVWFTSKGIRNMRTRLGLTKSDFARLCGVTIKPVIQWETPKNGKLKLRPSTIETLTRLRSLSPAGAQKALEELKNKSA